MAAVPCARRCHRLPGLRTSLTEPCFVGGNKETRLRVPQYRDGEYRETLQSPGVGLADLLRRVNVIASAASNPVLWVTDIRYRHPLVSTLVLGRFTDEWSDEGDALLRKVFGCDEWHRCTTRDTLSSEPRGSRASDSALSVASLVALRPSSIVTSQSRASRIRTRNCVRSR